MPHKSRASRLRRREVYTATDNGQARMQKGGPAHVSWKRKHLLKALVGSQLGKAPCLIDLNLARTEVHQGSYPQASQDEESHVLYNACITRKTTYLPRPPQKSFTLLETVGKYKKR